MRGTQKKTRGLLEARAMAKMGLLLLDKKKRRELAASFEEAGIESHAELSALIDPELADDLPEEAPAKGDD